MRSLSGACATSVPLSCSSCTFSTQPSGSKASCESGSSHAPVHNSLRANLRLLWKRNHVHGSKLPRPSRSFVRASNSDENLDSLSSNSTTTTSESEKDTLAAKLAAAEAEAEALKKELAARRGGSREVDLAKLKIPTPDKRIDGTGYREQLFSGPGAAKEPKKWGLTEAELFLSKGAPTEGAGFGGEALEAGADATIKRRLVIGLSITGVAVALAFIKLPVILSKPMKPLFFYLTYILRLKNQLVTLENNGSDAKSVETQLQKSIGSKEDLKDNFLSAATLLEGANADRASRLAFDILEYLNQANYSKYFENLGEPTSTQQVEFLKFSLQSIQAARLKIDEYLALIPTEDLQAAKLQLAQ